MDKQIAELRSAVSALGAKKPGRRIPSSVRALAVAYATRGRARGETWKAMARQVGLSSESLRRWTEAAAAPTGATVVVPVRVRGASGSPEAASTGALTKSSSVAPRVAVAGRALVLVSPRGFRLEGLELREAHLLLEALS